MIAIVDYGMGNLRSVWKAFESVGHQAVVTRDPATIRNAGHVVLPGVGAFGDCMENLERFDLVEPVRCSIQSGKPFLGICLGLQLLFTQSEEFGVHKGLNIVPGNVRKFALDPALKVPHMGWNQVRTKKTSALTAGIDESSEFYFAHSYHLKLNEPSALLTETTYGIDFPSAIERDNIFGVQFHPEKSHDAGARLLKNFADI